MVIVDETIEQLNAMFESLSKAVRAGAKITHLDFENHLEHDVVAERESAFEGHPMEIVKLTGVTTITIVIDRGTLS